MLDEVHPREKYGWQSWARWQVSIWKVALDFTAIHDKPLLSKVVLA